VFSSVSRLARLAAQSQQASRADSADASETLAEAYLADGQKDLARRHAEKALALLDAHAVPASSWTDTEPYRGEIRRSAQQILKKLAATP
jgi:protoheme ferro-lyase